MSETDLEFANNANIAAARKFKAERDALVKALEDIDKHLDNFGYLPTMKARKLARAALAGVVGTGKVT